MVDRIVLLSVWFGTILLLVLFTPRKKIREANVVFLFKQLVTWPLGLLVVEFHLIEYPVREFAYATQTSFAFEYFIYPATCVIYILRYPENKSRLKRIGWQLFWPTWMTLIEVVIERHTNLIDYIHWAWYWTWLSLSATFFLSLVYYRWFFRKGIGKAST
ncbi:CBO0543 family protein [Paenibacillus oryzisoli]|uniref:CBO0543 family protein n=1 Tax=Paenibacillus oryzisoli TaxID=1850517 RepID=UPI001EFA2E1B|nr:CBO0543 family protein [Paenibacillus oryzisoli]